MAWKQVGKYSYYYQSNRNGDRVTTEYFGRGQGTDVIAGFDELNRQMRLKAAALEKELKALEDREDKAFREWFDAIEVVADGAMLSAGYRKHHGQWRKKRDGQGNRVEESQAPREDDVR